MNSFEKPMTPLKPQKEAKPRVFPGVEAPGHGREIELELDKEQANFELQRDVVNAMSALSGSPEKLAKAFALIEAKYGQTSTKIAQEMRSLMLARMTPEEKEKFLSEQRKRQSYKITENDLPTEDELAAMGVKTM